MSVIATLAQMVEEVSIESNHLSHRVNPCGFLSVNITHEDNASL